MYSTYDGKFKGQAEHAEKLERHMSAVSHNLKSESKNKIDEDAFCKIKAEIRVTEKIIEEDLCERSRKARMKTVSEAQDKGRQLDVLYQQWYDWLRTTKRRNMDRETKRLVTQERTRVHNMIRNIKLLRGSKY